MAFTGTTVVKGAARIVCIVTFPQVLASRVIQVSGVIIAQKNAKAQIAPHHGAIKVQGRVPGVWRTDGDPTVT